MRDIFQNKIDELFSGMPNVLGNADDILIVSFDEQCKDHDKMPEKVLWICSQVNLKFKGDKYLCVQDSPSLVR